MVNEHVKRCATSYIIRELQIKRRWQYIPIRMARIPNADNTKWWQGHGPVGTHSLLVVMTNGTAALKESLVNFCLSVCFTKLNVVLSYIPAITFINICPG